MGGATTAAFVCYMFNVNICIVANNSNGFNYNNIREWKVMEPFIDERALTMVTSAHFRKQNSVIIMPFWIDTMVPVFRIMIFTKILAGTMLVMRKSLRKLNRMLQNRVENEKTTRMVTWTTRYPSQTRCSTCSETKEASHLGKLDYKSGGQ